MHDITVITNGSPYTFRSPHTDQEAIEQLCANACRGRFNQSLIEQHRQGRPLSPNQMRWVHYLVHRAANQRSYVATTLPNLRALLDEAREHIERPTVRLLVDGDDRDLVVKCAGERARVPGIAWLTMGGDLVGSIDLEGNLLNASPVVVRTLEAVERDPHAAIVAYGRVTGTCSCCGRGLTDGRSVAVGYGPVCAGKYGLPWGDVSTTTREEVTVHVGDVDNTHEELGW
jgi:hypothetical protein